MSAIRRPRVKVQANLGSKRNSKPTEDKKPVIIKDEEKDSSTTFKCPLSTITPSNINNNNDIPSNNILQKDLQSSNLSNGISTPPTPPHTNRRRTRTSSSSSAVNLDDHLDLKPVVSYKTKSDLHLNIPPRVRTESSSSSHSLRESRIRPEHGSSRIRTESVSSSYSESGPSKKSKMIRDVSNKDRSELTMFDLIYNYTPTANPMVKSELPPPLKTEQTPPKMPPTPPVTSSLPEDEDSSATPILVPQLKIGLNGEVIIDEQSLEIQTTAEKEAKKVLSNSSCIFMDEFTGSNGFYRKQKRTKEWPESETIKFYKCLHTVGTDFTLMMTLFPNRNRRDLKLKFKKEERVNENLIKKALLYPKAFNIEELEKVLAADEEEKRRQEEEWNEIKKKKTANKKPRKTYRGRKSKLKEEMSEGEEAYKNEGVMTQNITKTFKEERDASKNGNDVFLPEEEDTQSSSVMEVDIRSLKSEYVREITDFKQELLDQLLKDDEEEIQEVPVQKNAIITNEETLPEEVNSLPVEKLPSVEEILPSRVVESNKNTKRRPPKTWNRKPRKSKVHKSKVHKFLTEGEKAYEQEAVTTFFEENFPNGESCAIETNETQSPVMPTSASDLKSEFVGEDVSYKKEQFDASLNTNELDDGEIIEQYVQEDVIKIDDEENNSTSNKENVDEYILPKDDGQYEEDGSFYSPGSPENDEEEEEEEVIQSPVMVMKKESFDEDEEDEDDEEEEEEIQSRVMVMKKECFDEDFIDDMTPEEIITSVANGSLAVVTSESEEGETIYEVYKMCPNSGELSENPLNLHPEIINVIKMVV